MGNIILWAMPTPLWSLLYTTIVVYNKNLPDSYKPLSCSKLQYITRYCTYIPVVLYMIPHRYVFTWICTHTHTHHTQRTSVQSVQQMSQTSPGSAADYEKRPIIPQMNQVISCIICCEHCRAVEFTYSKY